ncbi:hypothetical protein ADUPG1_004025, partial [Aduncisulcus paluster]
MQNHQSVEKAELNFVTKELTLSTKDGTEEKTLFNDTLSLVKKLEPHVDVIPVKPDNDLELVFGLEGLNCSSCAGKIDTALQNMPEFSS